MPPICITKRSSLLPNTKKIRVLNVKLTIQAESPLITRSGEMGMSKALFSDLDGYENGVAARALLTGLIKQGNLEGSRDLPKREIVISIQQYQFRFLALFTDDTRACRQRIIEEPCQIR